MDDVIGRPYAVLAGNHSELAANGQSSRIRKSPSAPKIPSRTPPR